MRARLLAVAGVAGLMAAGLFMLVSIVSALSGDAEQEARAPLATPEPTPTPKPKPTPVPLTAEQRSQRRAAAEIVRGRGFEVVRLRDYDPRRELRVLLGRDGGGGRLAFFFVDDTYVGNDRPTVSEKLRVKRTGERQVTLTYDGDTDVRFRWDGATLAPRDPLPG